jgi:hypothetical protein
MILPQEAAAGDDAGLGGIAIQEGDDLVDQGLDRHPLPGLDAGIEIPEFRF